MLIDNNFFRNIQNISIFVRLLRRRVSDSKIHVFPACGSTFPIQHTNETFEGGIVISEQTKQVFNIIVWNCSEVFTVPLMLLISLAIFNHFYSAVPFSYIATNFSSPITISVIN